MAKIRFPHSYTKLLNENGTHPIRTAKLLQVVNIYIDDLTKEFLNYETDFGKGELRYDSLYLMILLQKPSGDLFTTLRPFTPDKRDYYKSLVGQDIAIEIT